MSTFSYSRVSQFAETDAAGVVHFTSILRYAEEAENALLQSLGLHLPGGRKPVELLWPRVSCSSEFLAPIRVQDPLRIEIGVRELGTSRIVWGWSVLLQETNDCVATGTLTTVACVRNGEGMKPAPIPEKLRARLLAYQIPETV